jgi:hypothetical protein
MLLTGVAYGQSNDPSTKRFNNLGERWYSGTDFSGLVLKMDNDSNNYFKFYKPVAFNRLTTTQQNALTLLSPGLVIYNTDTATLAFWDGSQWQYLATRAYARSVGGGGLGGDTTYLEAPLFARTGANDTLYLRYGYGLVRNAADSALRVDSTRGLGGNGVPTFYYVDSLFATSGGTGTVTSFDFTDGSGFNGTVTNGNTTPLLALTTTLTQGSVFFAGASGALAEDNTNFFYNTTDDRLGLGTATPASRLNVVTNALGVTQTTTSGLLLANTTAAAAGAQQMSPELRFRGNGWKTNTTAASQTVDFRLDVLPIEGAANPTGNLRFGASINGAAFTNFWNLQSAGHWVPEVTGTYDIGTTGIRVRRLMVNGINLNTSTAPADNTLNVASGFNMLNGSTPSASGGNIMTMSSAATAANTGTTDLLHLGTFGINTTGTAAANVARIQNTVNSTSSAPTGGYVVDWTLTAAVDPRAFWNTIGNNAFNSTSGFTWIGGAFAQTPRKLYVNGSIGANKDSITLQSTEGARHMLVIDTTTGRFERMTMPAAATTIYTGDGTLAGNRTVTMSGNTLNFTGGSVGFSTSGPDRLVDILSNANPQLRLTHTDGSVYTDFQTDGNGVLNITPTGSPGRYIAIPTGATGNKGYVGNVIWNESNVATTSGTTETDLYSFTTRANEFGSDAEWLEYYVNGVFDPGSSGAGATKTLRVYWAGTAIFTMTTAATTNVPFEAHIKVMRISSTQVRTYVVVYSSAILLGNIGNPTYTTVNTTFSNTNIIKVTGQTTNASDQVEVRMGTLKWFPQNAPGT